MDFLGALNRTADRLREEIGELRRQLDLHGESLRLHDTLIATILGGGLSELASNELERDPATMLAHTVHTSRRVVLDADHVLIDRQTFENFAAQQRATVDALRAAVNYAEDARGQAQRAQALAADLLVACREIGSAHGIRVTIQDGRAMTTRESGPTSIDEAACQFDQMVSQAVTRVERELKLRIERILADEGQYLNGARMALENHLRERYGRDDET